MRAWALLLRRCAGEVEVEGFGRSGLRTSDLRGDVDGPDVEVDGDVEKDRVCC